MTTAQVITDPGDGRVDDFRGLSDAVLRRRVEGGGLFVAEGELVVRRLISTGLSVRAVLVSPRGLRRLADVVEDARTFPVYLAEQPVLDAVVGFHAHRGVFATALRPARRQPAQLVAAAAARATGGSRSVLAVAEDLTDHENLGALFRNAAGLGVDGVLLSPRCCDPLYRRSIRVSMGAVLTLPWARVADTSAGLELLAGAGYDVVGMSPGAGAVPLTELAPALGDRVAVVLGAEGPGLSEDARRLCHRLVRLPMSGGIDSLNVATAAAIAFHVLMEARKPQ